MSDHDISNMLMQLPKKSLQSSKEVVDLCTEIFGKLPLDKIEARKIFDKITKGDQGRAQAGLQIFIEFLIDVEQNGQRAAAFRAEAQVAQDVD